MRERDMEERECGMWCERDESDVCEDVVMKGMGSMEEPCLVCMFIFSLFILLVCLLVYVYVYVYACVCMCVSTAGVCKWGRINGSILCSWSAYHSTGA